jgi:hypothetical protein
MAKAMTGLGNAAPAIGVPEPFLHAPPTQNQVAYNARQVIAAANPLVATMLEQSPGVAKKLGVEVQPGATVADSIARQFPRYRPEVGKPPGMMANYPAIVMGARTTQYVNGVIHAARKLDISKRAAWIDEKLKEVPAAEQKHAYDTIKHSKVLVYK